MAITPLAINTGAQQVRSRPLSDFAFPLLALATPQRKGYQEGHPHLSDRRLV